MGGFIIHRRGLPDIASRLPPARSLAPVPSLPLVAPFGKGQTGSALMRPLQFFYNAFWQRDLLGTPVNLLLSCQMCQGVPFSQNLSKLVPFAAAPPVLTPFVRNQIAPCPRRHDRAPDRPQTNKQQNNDTTIIMMTIIIPNNKHKVIMMMIMIMILTILMNIKLMF